MAVVVSFGLRGKCMTLSRPVGRSAEFSAVALWAILRGIRDCNFIRDNDPVRAIVQKKKARFVCDHARKRMLILRELQTNWLTLRLRFA
jgi:hypothetical protein